jgi:hypothetical protein
MPGPPPLVTISSLSPFDAMPAPKIPDRPARPAIVFVLLGAAWRRPSAQRCTACGESTARPAHTYAPPARLPVSICQRCMGDTRRRNGFWTLVRHLRQHVHRKAA